MRAGAPRRRWTWLQGARTCAWRYLLLVGLGCPAVWPSTGSASPRPSPEIGITLGLPAMWNLAVSQRLERIDARLSGMYYGPDLYGAQGSVTRAVKVGERSSHSLGAGYIIYHFGEDWGPQGDDEDFVGHALAALYAYRHGRFYVEVGPVLLVNRGRELGATFQVGAAGRPWTPLARTGRRIAAAATTPDASKRESWYLLFGLGYAHPSYSGSLRQARAQGTALSDADRFMLAMDLVGAYLPYGRRLLYGAMFNGAADTYQRSEANRVQIYQYLLSASTLVFANEIGTGPFLRAELGPAFHVVERAIGGAHDTEESDTGLGGLAGVGYAVPVSAGTRLLLNGNCALRRVEGSTTTTLAITLGGLF